MLQYYWIRHTDGAVIFGDLLLAAHVLMKIANGYTPSRALVIDMSILYRATVSESRCIRMVV